MIVTFCGHSKIYQTGDFSKWLDIILPSLIEGGAATFYLGGYGDFDSLAASAVRRQKAVYPIDCRFNKPRLISQIRKIAEQKKHIQVYNLEALNFIEDVILKKRKSFTFFDPPYYSKGPGLYTNFYSHGDHVNLANTIIQQMKNRKWIVTYDNVNAIKSMYAKTPRIEFKLQYTLQEKRSSSEVMFFSKDICRPLNEDKLLKILKE